MYTRNNSYRGGRYNNSSPRSYERGNYPDRSRGGYGSWRHNGSRYDYDDNRDNYNRYGNYDNRRYDNSSSRYSGNNRYQGSDQGYRGNNSNYNRNYDSDIYENEFDNHGAVSRDYYYDRFYHGDRNDQYNRNDNYSRDYDRGQYRAGAYRDRNDDRNFFERAGDRIRETWNDWRSRNRNGNRREPFNEDRERHYGNDTWAPNRNRGRNQSYRNRRYEESYV